MQNESDDFCNDKPKLKVCFVITGDLWAGAEAQVYSLLCAFEKSGRLLLSIIVFNKGLLAVKLIDAGFKVEVIEEHKCSVLKLYGAIKTFLVENKPDIVHCHGYKENFLAGLAARTCRIKVVRTHHGIGMLESNGLRRLIEWFNDRLLTHQQISVSDDLKSVLIRNNIPDKKITVVHNGLNTGAYSISGDNKQSLLGQYGINEHSVVVGTVGRLEPVKGHHYFLDVARQITARNKDVFFIIIGDGPLYESHLEYIREHEIEENVKLLGFKSDVMNYIQSMDIFLLPSIYEGIPMVLLEAMHMKKSVIASNVGGIPEVIDDAVDGILVDVGDVNQMVASLNKIMSDKVLMVELGGNAFRKIEEGFLISKTEDKTYDVYDNVLRSR